MSLMTSEELRAHLRMGEQKFRLLMKAGRIPFLRLGHCMLRFDREKVEAELTKDFGNKPHVGKAGWNLKRGAKDANKSSAKKKRRK